MIGRVVSRLCRGQRGWSVGALVFLLFGALLLRLHGIDFGLPALNDPDELMFGLGAMKMLRGPTLNPGWFGHPATTTMYVLAVVDVLVVATGYMMGWFPTLRAFGDAVYADPSWLILPSRMVMAVFALGTIFLTFRLGSQLFDRRVGIAAALLMAINPLHIAYSQVIRSDIMASFFMLLCLLAALRIARTDRWRDHVLAAFWLGMAIATKWPFALSALAVIAVILVRAWREPDRRPQALRRLLLFGLMGIGFLVLISPYLLLDSATLFRNLAGEAQLRHVGATAGAPWWNALWYLRGPLLGSFGAAAMAMLVIGLILLWSRREAFTILGPLIAGFFMLICFQTLIWERWALPLMPLLAIVAALGLIWTIEWLLAVLPRALAGIAVACLCLAIVLPSVLTARANAAARLNDTRQQASRWARTHIPAGSRVLIEHFAFDLVQEPWQFSFPLAEAGCVDVRAMLRGKISYDKIDRDRGGRSNVDYGTLPPTLRETCQADYAILTQYDRYRAERTDFPTENANYAWLLGRGEIVATFTPKPGVAGGPVVRVVRFGRQSR